MDTWCCPPLPFTESISSFYPSNHSNSSFTLDSTGKTNIIASTIYRDIGPNTSSRINLFYGFVTQRLDSIYLAPYNPSNFSKVNLYKARRSRNFTLLPSYLERELINSLSLVHEAPDLIVIAKSTGSLNSGISLFTLEKNYNLVTDDLPELFGYDGFHIQAKYLYDNNLWTCKPNTKIYIKELHTTSTTKNKFRGLDILELKCDNKNLTKSLIYARNFYGFTAIAVDLHSLKLEIIKAEKYTDKKIYNISISPYEVGTAALLTKNAISIHSFVTDMKMDIDLSSKKLKTDVQTICYGSSANTILMGGHNLFIQDLRTNEPTQALLDNVIKAHITTNSRWSFRRIKTKRLYKDRRYFSADSCAYSNYYRESDNLFWDAITAIASHPTRPNIIAFVYGVSNCIYIFDLNMPTRPLYELPLGNSVHLGSRCRHLEWVETRGLYKWLLVPFNWRDKVINIFQFDSNLAIPAPKHSSFELDVNILEESSRFPNYSGLYETNSDINMPIISSESNLLNSIFHGYSGITFAMIGDHLHTFLASTSGRLIDASNDGEVFNKYIKDNSRELEKNIVNNTNTNNIDAVEDQIKNIALRKSKIINIPDDKFLDKICDVKIKGLVDCAKRVDIPSKFKFDSKLTSSEFTMGFIDHRIDSFDNLKLKKHYNNLPVEGGFKYFKIDRVKYLTNYTWKKLEKVERLDQKCPYAELHKSYHRTVKQSLLPNLNLDIATFEYDLQYPNIGIDEIIKKNAETKLNDIIIEDIADLSNLINNVDSNEPVKSVGFDGDLLDFNIIDKIINLDIDI